MRSQILSVFGVVALMGAAFAVGRGPSPAHAHPGVVGCYLGEVRAFAGFVPRGWLPADGRELSADTYSALFGVIGTTYGGHAVPPVSFRLPDLRGRVPIGAGQGTGLAHRPQGQAGGAESATASGAAVTVAAVPKTAVTPSVAGWPVQVGLMPPFQSFNYGICVDGAYPSRP